MTWRALWLIDIRWDEPQDPAPRSVGQSDRRGVCSATYTRQNNVGYGQGYVSIQVHNAPGCTGGVVGNYQYLGSGAANGGYQHSEAERLQLFERATTAATQGTRINLLVESVGGGIYQTTYSAN